MNIDDILEAPEGQRVSPRAVSEPFDKEAWAAQKQQDKERAFALMNETAQRVGTDGTLCQKYLDVQARFDRYSVGNALLIAAQRPDMTEPADAKTWKEKGVYIKKGETGTLILEPVGEYTRADGSVGVSYRAKRVFDVSQTNAKQEPAPTVNRDPRLLLKALIHNAPCALKISRDLPEQTLAVYRPEARTIFVRQGLEPYVVFRAVAQELAMAHMAKGPDFKRHECQFTALCAAYILCRRYHVPTGEISFHRMPSEMQSMEAKDIRRTLERVRDVSNEISFDMNALLNRQHGTQNREPAAR